MSTIRTDVSTDKPESRLHFMMRLAGGLLYSRQAAAVYLFMAGFLLTRASFFAEYSPLGLSFAAAGAKKHKFSALLGAVMGYITANASIDGLKYIAAIMLCFFATKIFKDTKALEYSVFMPLITAVSMSGVGLVFLWQRGANIRMTALYMCEIGVAASAVWFYEKALSSFGSHKAEGKAVSIGRAALFLSVLCAFSDFTLMGIISPVRVAALIFVMYVSCVNGAGAGASAGLTSGIIMDARLGGMPFFSLAYAASGLMGGLLNSAGRFLFIIMFIFSGTASAVWGAYYGIGTSYAYEMFAASVIFMIIPQSALENFKECKTSDNQEKLVSQIKETTADKILAIAAAFKEAYTQISDNMELKKHRNDEDITAVFDFAAEKVCRKCAIRHSCWEREYVSTLDALNSASSVLLKGGKAKAENFPSYFASRCLHFTEFVGQINTAAGAIAKRKQQKLQAKENSSIICEQYAGIADILKKTADSILGISHIKTFDSKKLRLLALEYAENCTASVFRQDGLGLRIEIKTPDASEIIKNKTEFLSSVSKLLGHTFSDIRLEKSGSFDVVKIAEIEHYFIQTGVASRHKRGQEISGDNGGFFKTDDGTAYMLLSDGMGTGIEAAVASNSVVRLFERFLSAGLSPKEALNAAYPVLTLENENQGFATLDIAGVNLYNGSCTMLKCGAAQSYVKECGKTRKISGKALPPGVLPSRVNPPDISKMCLREGDYIVMISDGVADACDDDWIMDIIDTFCGNDPNELAQIIIANAALGNTDDDMTVMAMRIGCNN